MRHRIESTAICALSDRTGGGAAALANWVILPHAWLGMAEMTDPMNDSPDPQRQAAFE